jgi:hypothetical protein
LEKTLAPARLKPAGDDHMKTFQGAFHLNDDASTWYDYAKLAKNLAEIRDEALTMLKEKPARK